MEDTFTMKDVESMELEPTAAIQDEPKKEEPKEAKSEASSEGSDSPANFIEKFKSAKNGATEEPKAEEKAKEPEPQEEELSRSAKDFKLLKEERDQAKQQIAEMEKKLSELKDNNVNEVLEELKQKNDHLSEQLRTAALEKHPEFIQKYDGKIDQVISSAKATVGEHNEDRIERLLRMDESEMRNDGIEAIFDELSPARRAKLGAMLAQIDNIKAERANMLSNQQETINQLNEKYDQQERQRIADSDSAFNTALQEASQHVEVFQKRDGDNDWNGDIDTMVASAKQLFSGDGGTSLEEMARATLWAAAAPRYRHLLGQALAENQKLRGQIAGLEKSNPSLSGSPDGEAKGEERTFKQLFSEASGFDLSE